MVRNKLFTIFLLAAILILAAAFSTVIQQAFYPSTAAGQTVPGSLIVANLYEYVDVNGNGYRDASEPFFVEPLNEDSWSFWFFSDNQCEPVDYTEGFKPIIPKDNSVVLQAGCRYLVQGGPHDTAGTVGSTCYVGEVFAEGTALMVYLPRSCAADNLFGTPTPIVRTATPTATPVTPHTPVPTRPVTPTPVPTDIPPTPVQRIYLPIAVK